MKKVGFIGEYDKTDLIIYVAKILTQLGKKVLILDATQKQKTRYVVPAINPTISYIIDFQNIDVAVGFKSFEEVKSYLGVEEENLKYDIALIDIDKADAIEDTNLAPTDKIYFVTAFDLYSLKKGVEILYDLKETLKLTKIYFSRIFYNEDNEYLEFLALDQKVVWDENIIYFPLENGDQATIAENQRVGKIKFKNLSSDYKNGIISLASDILGKKIREAKTIFRNLE